MNYKTTTHYFSENCEINIICPVSAVCVLTGLAILEPMISEVKSACPFCFKTEKQVEELDLSAIKNMPPLNHLTKYADSVVKWFVAFLSKIKRVVKMQTSELQSPRSATQSMDSLGGAGSDSQLSSASENSRASAIYEDLLLGGDIILDVIYSTRENVHIVHEVFRQVN